MMNAPDLSNVIHTENPTDANRVKNLGDVITRSTRVSKIFSDSASGMSSGCSTGFPVVNWDDWRCYLRMKLRNCDGVVKQTGNNRDTLSSSEDSSSDSDFDGRDVF
jgi:hypothetical protein